jgi:coenzyme F420-reducing hydrogenase delta subunit
VYLVACPIGNCHHVRGNERGKARVDRAKLILDEIGLGGDRLDMFFMSGSQGHSFAIAAQQMTDRIRALGPNPLNNKNGAQSSVSTDQTNIEEDIFRGRKLKDS